MRKLIILAVLAYVGYGYFNGTLDLPMFGTTKSAHSASQTTSVPASFDAPPQWMAQPTYSCDGRQHCSQMRSYEEASFFLRNCPNTKMDGDGDGIPCEQQFRR